MVCLKRQAMRKLTTGLGLDVRDHVSCFELIYSAGVSSENLLWPPSPAFELFAYAMEKSIGLGGAE